MNRITLTVAAACLFTVAGCDQKPAAAPTAAPAASANKPPTAEGAHAASGKHADEGHAAEAIELGSTTIGGLTVRVARDKQDIKPGGDAPIDAWLSLADGKPASVTAVRFWIGTEDAKGAIKSKADIENPKEPNHWHTHAEIPNPLPEGAKLWIEIESASGKHAGSVDLKL